MKRFARRVFVTVCCLLTAGTLVFPLELGARLTQPPWPPIDPGAIPTPSPTPGDPNQQEEDAGSISEGNEANDSQDSDDPGNTSPSPSPAHPDGAER
jgi:hypothetical protein